MRLTTVSAGISFLVIFLFTFSYNRSEQGGTQGSTVILYSGSSYRGASRTFMPGTYSGAQLGQLNRDASSIRVPSDKQVIAYDEKGKSISIAYNIPDLGVSGWDNRIVKLVVQRKAGDGNGSLPPTGNRVILYEQADYQGESRAFDPGNQNSGTLGSLYLRVSAIYIPPGRVVTVKDRSGQQATFTKSYADLAVARWDNRIHSFSITGNDSGGPDGGGAGSGETGVGGSGKPGGKPGGGPAGGSGGPGSGGPYVILAEECGYRGQISYLAAGNYTTAQLGIRNNSLASLEIPFGMAMQIFDGDRFSGASKTFTRAEFCLDPEWRYRASSVRVFFQANPGSGGANYIVTMYADKFGRGPFVNIGMGTVSYVGANFERAASSIYVLPGYAITVYDQPDLRGNSRTFTGRVEDLSPFGWNDRVASAYVFKR
ncbi:hypothetical protein [Flavihumibacter petaseus]|uniref:Uncharacterized protein n=1 Tax=Flavihumibacter petaseus NBRC 106054 TaxID=1220578 RepID=A0A0E9N6V0_9BACT|nr:hypothetical protein [Flavihumibacter petaseus]GAO45677.1 hypothetical protein FPE01S_07_00650 [Flavihumibacter petaseus NBRC 106054]